MPGCSTKYLMQVWKPENPNATFDEIFKDATFRFPSKPEATIPLAVIAGERHLTTVIMFRYLSDLKMLFM